MGLRGAAVARRWRPAVARNCDETAATMTPTRGCRWAAIPDRMADHREEPPDESPVLLPPHTARCMGFGPDNLHGIEMAVHRCGDEVFTDIAFDERHLGAPGLAHGGAIAAACDDLPGSPCGCCNPGGHPPPHSRVPVAGPAAPPAPHQRPPHRKEGPRSARHCYGTGDDSVTRFTATAVFVAVDTDHFAAHGDRSRRLRRACSTGFPATPDLPGDRRHHRHGNRIRR